MESSEFEFEVTIEQPDEAIDRCRCPVSLSGVAVVDWCWICP